MNTPTGVIVAFFASLCGFAVIWYIWWLAILGLVGAFAIFVWYAWRDEHEHVIPVEEVRANARERRRIRMEHLHRAEPVDMSTQEAAAIGLTHGGSEDTGLGNRGPQSKSIVVPYGFWLFVLSDMVLFSALFATYASLVHATDGGPATDQLFDRNLVAIETLALLVSSFVCGLAMIAAKRKNMLWTQGWLLVTGLLGLVFLSIELFEFGNMIGEGAGPQRSAFLSSFFTLVGCHGAHVTAGLLWIGTMMAQIWAKGFQPHITRRLLCLSVFWHALDIIWVAIFTIVYLIGTLP